ncbi:MAG: 2-C-methyl-D-erythritol 4-phosphate cytidylyltransferase [Acidimicrobiales bacterium]
MWGIVVAAGQGRRFGAPKQFAPLAGATVLSWSVAALAPAVEGVVVVVPPGFESGVVEGAGTTVVVGGATRSASVRAGLASVPAEATVIVVHDGARPLAAARLFADVVAAVQAGADAAVPGVPVPDTVKRVKGTTVTATVPREQLVLVQTPQAFAAAALRQAHAGDPEATDDAGLVEAAGGRVVLVPGDQENLKVTHPGDLVVAEARLAGRAWRP